MLSERGKSCQRTTENLESWGPEVQWSKVRPLCPPERMLESPALPGAPQKTALRQSFPQVWKKLWKTRVFCSLRPENAVFASVPARRKLVNPCRIRVSRGWSSGSLAA